MEKELLRQALEKDIPILGICRGIQFINAFLG
jgi:putative glutamine amidotransferase